MSNKLAFLLLLLVAVERSDAHKASSLSFLALLPFSGTEPRDSKMCQAAIQIAADYVNSRSDILPDYRIEVLFRDESPGAMRVVQHLVDFSRNFSGESSIFQSPVTIGPLVSDGCKRIAKMAHHFNMVGIGLGCYSPILTANRRLYPNFYRISAGGEMAIMSRLIFISQVGKWKRIAIVTHTRSVYDYTLAAMTQAGALEIGVQIIRFELVIEITPTVIQSLKESDARIIIVDVNIVSILVAALCEMYQAGITGNRYVFITQANAFSDPLLFPETISDRCSRGMLIKQYESTYWIGSANEPSMNYGLTSLDYDLTTFEEMFANRTNNSQTPDSAMRYPCHDAMLEAIIALDDTEKKLRSMNITLKDYNKYPELVMQVANQSLAQIKFTSLRNGLVRYSSRVELDSEHQSINHWTFSTRMTPIATVTYNGFGNLSNFSSYDYQHLHSIVWPTDDNRPPADEAGTRQVVIRFPWPVSIFSFSIVALVGCVLVKHLYRAHKKALLPRIESAVLIAKFGINCGALVLAFNSYPSFASAGICKACVSLSILGFAVLNGALFGLMFLPVERAVLLNLRSRPSFRTFPTNDAKRRQSSICTIRAPLFFLKLESVKAQETFIAKVMLSLLSCVTIYLCCWMAIRGNSSLTVQSLSLTYDKGVDLFTETTSVSCSLDLEWVVPFLVAISFLILSGLIKSYQHLKRRSFTVIPYFKLTWIIMANNMTLLVAVAFLSAVISSPVYKEVVVAVVLLLTAGLPTFAWHLLREDDPQNGRISPEMPAIPSTSSLFP